MNQIPTTGTKRNYTADLLKGVAVICMIQVHILEQFAREDLYDSALGKVSLFFGGPFCAPVFMAVMGYFLASTSRSHMYLFKRGIFLFAGGIALNIARSANLLIHVIKGELNLDPYRFIFGADILTLAGFSIILISALRIIFKKNCLLWLLAALAVSAAGTFLPDFSVQGSSEEYIQAFFWGKIDWSYFPLFPWFAYVLLGYSFRLVPEKLPKTVQFDLRNYIFSVPLLLVVVVSIPYAAFVSCDLYRKYYHHGVLFFIWMILFMTLWVMITDQADKIAGDSVCLRSIRWIGRNVTVIYVIQWIIIGNFATEIYKTQNLPVCIIWFIFILPASCFLAGIYKKALPLLKPVKGFFSRRP